MAELRLVLTADYEVFGDGTGDVRRCLLEPAERLLATCEAAGALMTLFVDVCELWAFRDAEAAGSCPAGYAPARWIEAQLVDAVRRGHDVQLHFHPQWLDCSFEGPGRWKLNFDLWRLSALPLGDVAERHSLRGLFAAGKSELEALLRPHDDAYRCRAFRAGAWCIQPEGDVLTAMREQGLRYDTTVAPGFDYDDGRTRFDFTAAPQGLPGWPIADRVDRPAAAGELYEVPIFTHRLQGRQVMLEYCERTAAELEELLAAGRRRFAGLDAAGAVPLVAIGHPKGFADPAPLEALLGRVADLEDVRCEPLGEPSLWRAEAPTWLAPRREGRVQSLGC